MFGRRSHVKWSTPFWSIIVTTPSKGDFQAALAQGHELAVSRLERRQCRIVLGATDAYLDAQELERDRLVTPTAFPTIPPRVDYELTKLGHSRLDPVSRLGMWARQNRAAIQKARRRFDSAKARD
jgi:hypothetical protein